MSMMPVPDLSLSKTQSSGPAWTGPQTMGNTVSGFGLDLSQAVGGGSILGGSSSRWFWLLLLTGGGLWLARKLKRRK